MTLRASLSRGAARILAVDVRSILVSSRHTELLFNNPDKNGQQHPCRPAQYWPSLFAAGTAALAARDERERESNRALCMPLALTVAGSKGGKRSTYEAGDALLDPYDSSDNAFELVVNHRFKINDARRITKTSVSYSALWDRVRRYSDSLQLREKEIQAAHGLASLLSATASGERGGGAKPSVTPQTSTARKGRKRQRKSPPTDLGIATFPSSPKPLYDRHAAAVDASIENLPDWVNKNVVKKTMVVKKRNSAGMVNKNHFNNKVKRVMRDARYKAAFKSATDEAYSIEQRKMSGQWGNGLNAIVARHNLSHLSDPGDRKLSKTTLQRALVKRRQQDQAASPPKNGRPAKVVREITDQITMQAAMMQASGEGEATTAKLKRTLTAMTAGTKHEDTFNNEYAVLKARRLYPEVLCPVSAINDDDRRVDWLTYKNINSWTNAVKQELIDLGVVYDKPGFISEFLARDVCIIFSANSNFFLFHLFPSFLYRRYSVRGDFRSPR